MPTPRCAPDCPKMAERRKLYEKKISKKKTESKFTETDDDLAPSTITSRTSPANLSLELYTSSDDDDSRYMSLPYANALSKDKDRRRKQVAEAERVQKIHKMYDEDSPKRTMTPKQKRVKTEVAVEIDEPATSRAAATSPNDIAKRRKSSPASKGDPACQNDECTEKPKIKRRVTRDVSELSSDPSCPALCEMDLVKIAEPKQRCDSACPSQKVEDEKREKDQADVDRFVLYGGLRYFDDLCHCSLKCLLIQIFNDKFVQKTASSVLFFAMSMKLCFELDSWYIPFRN